MNTLHNSGERSGDEPKQPPTPPISPISSSPHAHQQQEGASKLSGHSITPPKEDIEILEVERRVHDIARRLIEYLDIQGISASSYPKVERVSKKWIGSHYSPSKNAIGLEAEHFNNGFIIGEEVAHWLHDQCLRMRTKVGKDDPQLTASQRSNSKEFVGYIGRELARQACADSELQHLFDPKSEAAPMKVTDLRGEHAAAEKQVNKRSIWSKEYFEKASLLVIKSSAAALKANLKNSNVDRSPESLNSTSLREIIDTQTMDILLPMNEALEIVPTCSTAEELEG